jgi:hypothetical protein
MNARQYWPYYCEENVWHAAASDVEAGRRAFAVFVSNPSGQVAMWQQRAAPEGEPLLWDYHVVLLARHDAGWTVWDPDCRAGDHLPARDWLARSFGEPPRAIARFAPCFRVVAAARYRETLRSDRSHMLRGKGYRRPPPPWPAIGQDGEPGTNLMRFVDMRGDGPGEVLDLATLRDRVIGAADWPARSAG